MPPVVGFVCEGPTDLPVLEAVVDAILGRGYVPRQIQPETDKLHATSGWTAVRAWCKEMGTRLEQYLTFAGIDILVVHIDADVGGQMGAATTTDVCRTVKSWLGPGARDERLLVVVPARASDTWLLAAHSAVTPQVEDDPHPARALVARKLLESDADGKPKKHLATYRRLAPRIAERLADLRRTLPEIDRFAGDRRAERLGHPAPAAAIDAVKPRRAKRRR